jgi:hypothetical protein
MPDLGSSEHSRQAPAFYHPGYLGPYRRDSSRLTPSPRLTAVFTPPSLKLSCTSSILTPGNYDAAATEAGIRNNT